MELITLLSINRGKSIITVKAHSRFKSIIKVERQKPGYFRLYSVGSKFRKRQQFVPVALIVRDVET